LVELLVGFGKIFIDFCVIFGSFRWNFSWILVEFLGFRWSSMCDFLVKFFKNFREICGGFLERFWL